MPRAVLDTNVLVSGLIAPGGPSARLLTEWRAGAFELIVSPMLLAELVDVLHRPKLRRYVSEDEADAYVELIRQESIVMDDSAPSSKQLSADPDDGYLIDLARASRVDALVTGDARLLELHDIIPVRTPREFLESLTVDVDS